MKKNASALDAVNRSVLRSVRDDELAAVTGAGLSLSYTRVEWVYTQQKPDGAGGSVTAK